MNISAIKIQLYVCVRNKYSEIVTDFLKCYERIEKQLD